MNTRSHPSPDKEESQEDPVQLDMQESQPLTDYSLVKAISDLSLSSEPEASVFNEPGVHNFDYDEIVAITSNFSPISKISIGGFGEVFKACHVKYGLLSIKRPRQQFCLQQNEEVMQMIHNEVKHLSRFCHENIVRILGSSENGPVPCLVFEYMEGGSLFDKIAERVLTEKLRLGIMRGAAEGLRYLHGDGDGKPDGAGAHPSEPKPKIIHGDVKSSSILLTRDLVPKLCNFDLAKECEDEIVMPYVMGTRPYMAPEALTGTIRKVRHIRLRYRAARDFNWAKTLCQSR